MYPYMADYPYTDIHRFWYKNIKNEGLSEEESELDSEDKKKLDGEIKIENEDSRNSDLIKQELKRKRKRPKKKKNLNNDNYDNNMLDEISEFSKSTIKQVIARSEIEINKSRSSSVLSMQKSVPEQFLFKKTICDVRSEASEGRLGSPKARTGYKKLMDRKNRVLNMSMNVNDSDSNNNQIATF